MEDIIMEKIDDYLQINEAAAYLGISPSTLRNWEKQ
jgi:DNA-binding transcriptional regulator YiaG